MNTRSALLLAASLVIIAPSPAFAHGAGHAQHGGIVQMTGEVMFELARRPAGVSLYVEDEGDPITAKSFTATLTITAGGKKQTVSMTPQTENQFFAKGLKLASGMRVAVQIINTATKARTGTVFVVK